ncbi:hypothetical protein [Natrarchaeobaculum aegyptiacum]|uniref:Uncharacterized protein n=1 Tax=Natrarchaeobaculum aegyptiacum TaxID=745377 RepID=A0A2Z2HUE2_9EURY|nr:hypothetical protein [Natrarchaeobaculum aegyptiacum]ARS90792.1 hypothetical protein B1756_14390 [Natrarchaeobaculum aegyptiacum]
MPLSSVIRQLRGTVSNITGLVGNLNPIALLPPTVRSSLVWVRDAYPRGLGFADRETHTMSFVAVFGLLLLKTGWWLTILSILYFVLMFPIVVARYIPAVEQRWPFDKDSWPFWTMKNEV